MGVVLHFATLLPKQIAIDTLDVYTAHKCTFNMLIAFGTSLFDKGKFENLVKINKPNTYFVSLFNNLTIWGRY